MGAAVLLVLVLGLTGCPGQADIPTIPTDQLTAEQKTILDAAIAWRRDIQSQDGETRVAALDRMQPTEADLAVLFGPETAAIMWADSQEGIEYTRTNYREKQSKLARSGEVIGGDLIDLRTDTTSSFNYTEVMPMLPPEIGVYRVLYVMGKGRQSHSAFMMLNGEVRMVSGLERIPEYLRDLKVKQSMPTTDTAEPAVPVSTDSASE